MRQVSIPITMSAGMVVGILASNAAGLDPSVAFVQGASISLGLGAGAWVYNRANRRGGPSAAGAGDAEVAAGPAPAIEHRPDCDHHPDRQPSGRRSHLPRRRGA